MSKASLIGLMSIGAGIGALYLVFKQLSERKQKPLGAEGNEFLTIELTRKIAQEIKYQTLVVCITFANQMDKRQFTSLHPAQLQKISQKLKKSITLVYQKKQALILSKYQVQKQVFGDSLRHYENDPQIHSIKTAIMDMMEAAVHGRTPDISVPQEALFFMQADQIVETYREETELVIVTVWRMIMEHIRDDPSFKVTKDQHFSKVIRKVGVYDLKVNFLLEKGYKQEWGCPNETFFKVIENTKIENKDFSSRIVAIEKSYQQLIQKISTTPSDYTEQQIKDIYNQEILRFQAINSLENSYIDHI